MLWSTPCLASYTSTYHTSRLTPHTPHFPPHFPHSNPHTSHSPPLPHLCPLVQAMSSADPLVALPAALLQCSHVCAVMATAGMGEVLSPQLAETLSWFESLWAKTYLHLNEKDYTQVGGEGEGRGRGRGHSYYRGVWAGWLS